MVAWILAVVSTLVFLFCLIAFARGGRSVVPMPKMSVGTYCIVMLVSFALSGAAWGAIFEKAGLSLF